MGPRFEYTTGNCEKSQVKRCEKPIALESSHGFHQVPTFSITSNKFHAEFCNLLFIVPVNAEFFQIYCWNLLPQTLSCRCDVELESEWVWYARDARWRWHDEISQSRVQHVYNKALRSANIYGTGFSFKNNYFFAGFIRYKFIQNLRFLSKKWVLVPKWRVFNYK